MTYKNTFMAFSLGIAGITQAFSGTMGAEQPNPFRGFYVDANVGYANYPWRADRNTTPGLENQLGVLTRTSNLNGGAIGGADIGYQLTQYISAEGGWSYLPTASYNRVRTVNLTVAATTFTLPEGLQIHIHSGFGYAAFKGMIPIYDKINAFGKLGAAYTYNHTNVNVPASLVNSATVHTTDHSNYWNPLLAFGLQYSAINNFSLNVQYNYIGGYQGASANHFITPPVQTVTFGLGYKFFT